MQEETKEIIKMSLTINKNTNEKYYLIATEELQPGDYIKITRLYINHNGKRIGNFIEAPESVIVLREEHIQEKGGLENIIKKLKIEKLKL